MSPQEQAAEKLRQQRIQEESDLKLAKEAFGKEIIMKVLIDRHPIRCTSIFSMLVIQSIFVPCFRYCGRP